MKRIHFIIIGLIILGIGLLISASGDLSTYSSFNDADKTFQKVKIVGTLSKDKEIYYEPTKDPNYFSFYLADANGREEKIIYLKAKPTDFEQSEQIVLTGKMKNGNFYATDMLLKCPSKYKDEELKLNS